MKTKTLTHREQKAADRSYHVLAHAPLEERRVTEMSDEEFTKRHREIVESCYGDEEAK